MAKKNDATSFLKKSHLVTVGILLCGAAWWGWNSATFANAKDQLLQYIDNRDIASLEAKYTPEQIIQSHKAELLGSDKRSVKGTQLKFSPYLLLNIKYLEGGATKEGNLLWGLNNGERVINTDKWETTHGYKDCIECKAGRSDFKIMFSLAKRGGTSSVEELQQELQVEREVLNSWIDGAKQKHLIVQKGNLLQLHFENPKLLASPQTTLKHPLVTRPLGDGQKMARTFSRDQVVATAQAAFGPGFTIRSEQEIFLPVYSIEVANPDGSLQVSHWNALTGQRVW